MTVVEDLLRRTFADRERDLDGMAPSLAAARERSRRRRRRQAAVLAAAAAAVVAVAAGSTVALTDRAQPGPPAATARPTPAPGDLPAFREASFSRADGRTRTAIHWAPTWLPGELGETGRLVTNSLQIRTYGRIGGGPVVRVLGTVEGCPPDLDLDGRSRVPGTEGVVAGKQAWSYSFRRAPRIGAAYLPSLTDPGHLVCVVVRGGGFWAFVTGTADTAADARRVVASVRAGGPAEVVVRISTSDYVDGVSVGTTGDSGRPTPRLGTANGDAVLGPPDPDAPAPNITVDGRPAHLTVSASKGAVLRIPLGPDLQAVFRAAYPDIGAEGNREAVLEAARGLRVGPEPDYGWLSR